MTTKPVLRNRAFILFALLSFTVSVCAVVAPTEAFSRLPYIESPSLSPDGSKIAYVQNLESPDLTVLKYIDLKNGEIKTLLQTDNLTNKIKWFKWGNNETLLLSSSFTRGLSSNKVYHTQLLAIDLGIAEPVQRRLIKNKTMFNKQHQSQYEDNVIDFLPDDPAHILIALDAKTPNLPSVFKLNINTSRARKIENRKLKIREWMTDQQGFVRLGNSINYKTGEIRVYVRKGKSEKWKTLFKYNGLTSPGITPLGFDRAPNILYYSQYKNDKKAIFKVDLNTDSHKLVYEDNNYDVDGSLIYSTKTREVIGINHVHGKIYWDKNRKNLQQRLDKARPLTENYLIDFSKDEYVYLFYTENDSTPGAYFLANRRTGKVNRLMTQYPELKEVKLNEHQLIEYTATDGTKIEGYLTLPNNIEKPAATILYPHGGPSSRDYNGFDYWTSFFTNQGYAVFRPNFRGSKGYGYEFSQSKIKNWGMIMQDDLTDAARWLISENIADPNRICIVGASYGGYAASMAAVKTPSLFKCAVSFAGVSDLRDIVFKSRYYTNKKFVENQIGKNIDDLKMRSPFYHAKKVNVPILLLHGDNDSVVNVKQSRKFSQKLESLGKKVKYIELKNGDHHLSIQHNRHQAFRAMGSFLKQHLKTNS